MIDSVIFDLDGTLVETREANFLAYQKAFAQYDLKLNKSDYIRNYGKKWDEWGPVLCGGAALEVHRAKMELYESFLHRIQPIEKYLVLLEAFSNTHQTFLLTNASQQCARFVLQKFSLRFTAEFYVENFGSRNRALDAITEAFRIHPQDTLLIDDNAANIQAARDRGFRTHLATV